MRVRTTSKRICQGDVYRDIELVEYVQEAGVNIEASLVTFPAVYVLTQDCDLEQDYRALSARSETGIRDKMMLSVLLAPLYNVEHVLAGDHLITLGVRSQPFEGRSRPQSLRQNDLPRYHYLEFPEEIPLPPSVIDFKHYFTVSSAVLRELRRSHFVCSVPPLFREAVSQRFASFLARIGLPEPAKPSTSGQTATTAEA